MQQQYDEKLLDYIEKNIDITDYNLKSVRFPMEHIKIPAFLGKLKIRVMNRELSAFINKLLRFGAYSGAGIKCSVGMGMIRLL